jgi:subtilisin family serine protease
MSKKKKSPGKAKPSAKDEKVGVLIEMKVSQKKNESMGTESAVAEMAASLGVVLDTAFSPVPVTPSNTQRKVMLEAHEDNVHVLVRAEVTPVQREKLKAHPDVVEVWSDAEIQPFACPIPPCDCDFDTPKGTLADVSVYLGVDQIWALGKRGEGIVVGVVDGGICATGRPLAAGEAPVRTINNVIGGWPVASWGTMGKSWGYHGNMCAYDIQGIAPNVRLYDLRIASGTTLGTISNAISAFEWAINRHKAGGTPQVLSNSWGMYMETWASDYATNPNHPFTRKVVEAVDEGITVLFAAGNCGDTCPDGRCGTDKSPGRSIWGANGHTKVMTVGAVNKNERFIGYSSQGPAALDPHKPDFCGITHFTGYSPCDNGTSAATPVVAGVTALLKQGKPAATPAQIKQAFINTSKDIGQAGWDQHSGAGIIRGKAAYDHLVTPKLLSKDLIAGALANEYDYAGNICCQDTSEAQQLK